MQEHVPLPRAKSRWNQAAHWLALAGVVGPILYVVVFTLAGFLRPGYSPVRQSISTLGVGANAWLLNTDAVVFGALLLAFAIGFFLLMQQVIKKGRLRTCLVLLILSSVGAINTGLFPAASATVVLHWTLGFLLGLLPLVAVYTIVGWQWRHLSNWRGYGWYSLATAIAAVVLILLSFVLLAPRSASGGPWTQVGGLIERVLVLVVFAWHVVIGWRLFTLTSFHQRRGSPREQKREPAPLPLEARD
jgi:hypothetical membrane protein